jgi:hypothetical protein
LAAVSHIGIGLGSVLNLAFAIKRYWQIIWSRTFVLLLVFCQFQVPLLVVSSSARGIACKSLPLQVRIEGITMEQPAEISDIGSELSEESFLEPARQAFLDEMVAENGQQVGQLEATTEDIGGYGGQGGITEQLVEGFAALGGRVESHENVMKLLLERTARTEELLQVVLLR